MAAAIAFGGVGFPNPFPFLLVALGLLVVGGVIHEQREGC